jgi:NADP-dependent 3-hydroxy acid dehydrogenase YdfG
MEHIKHMESTQLKDMVAIVTGSGSGIGRAIALTLAKEGAKVVCCGRRIVKVSQTVKEIQKEHGCGIAIQADVSLPVDVDRVVQTSIDQFHRIDILINNAGVADGTQIHASDIQSWDTVMSTNLRAIFLFARRVLPIMRQQQSGHMINISSESGLEYYQGDAIYGTSKHALNDLSEYMQRENQDFHIRVNTICPGMVVTEMTEHAEGLDHNKCLYPEDIADLALWLLTRRQNIKIGTPILIQTMLNPWE